MTRLNLLLLIALIASCVYLVRVSHDSRQLFAQLDRARNDERLLDSEFERLKSEKQSQATPLRVEKAAREQLRMVVASPTVMRQVTHAPAASAVAAVLPAPVVPSPAASPPEPKSP